MLGDATSRQAEGDMTLVPARCCICQHFFDKKMSRYEYQCVEISILPHVKMESPGVLWCSVISCDFKSTRVLSKDEVGQLSSKSLDLKSV